MARMSISTLLLVIMVSLAVATFSSAALAESQENTRLVAEDDPVMNKAIETARQSLPQFLETAKNPPKSWDQVVVKAALQGESSIEHIWISDFKEVNPGNYEGYLSNEPVNLPGLNMGDKVTFSTEQISDWAFTENGRGYGYYTLRAIVDSLPKEQAQPLLEFLSENPLPDSW